MLAKLVKMAKVAILRKFRQVKHSNLEDDWEWGQFIEFKALFQVQGPISFFNRRDAFACSPTGHVKTLIFQITVLQLLHERRKFCHRT